MVDVFVDALVDPAVEEVSEIDCIAGVSRDTEFLRKSTLLHPGQRYRPIRCSQSSSVVNA
jgi:hypothetical protein